MIDPTTPPSLVAELDDLKKRLGRLERSTRTAQALPVSTGQLLTTSSAAYVEMARSDFVLTSPILAMSLEVEPAAGVMDWRVRVGVARLGDPTVTAWEVVGATFGASLELPILDYLDLSAWGDVVSFRLDLRMTSGTGPVGLRLASPPLLKT